MMFLDINECQQGVSGCSQVCTNTIGSYKCSCYSGYQLSDDSHTCIGQSMAGIIQLHNYCRYK